MIPAHPEPELSAKIPSVERPEGILVTNKGIIKKSDNIDSGAPILLSVGDMLRPLEARKPNWRGLLSGAVVIIMLVITIYTIYKTKKGWCPRTGEGQRLMGM